MTSTATRRRSPLEDAPRRRLAGTHDATEPLPIDRRDHDRELLTGVEHLLITLIDNGLKASALRPAAMLVHLMDIDAREHKVIEQRKYTHAA